MQQQHRRLSRRVVQGNHRGRRARAGRKVFRVNRRVFGTYACTNVQCGYVVPCTATGRGSAASPRDPFPFSAAARVGYGAAKLVKRCFPQQQKNVAARAGPPGGIEEEDGSLLWIGGAVCCAANHTSVVLLVLGQSQCRLHS